MDLRRVENGVARLAGWWASELIGLFPRSLREARRRLLIELDGSTARFLLCEAQRVDEIAALDLGPDALASLELGKQARKACARVTDIAVRVAARQALRRTLTLPLAAERNLRGVLAFEMDRYTPFKAESVYYDFAVLGRDADKRQLQVALTLVPRKEVDALLGALRGWSLEPTSLGVEDVAGCNLLPAAQTGERQGARWPSRTLAAIAALLAVGTLALPLVQKMQTVERLEKQLAEARAEALRAEQVRKQLEQLVKEESALIERRKERPAAIQVLHELTTLLPDSVWLSHAELAGTRLKIRGESPNASELVSSIENSAMFQGASFDGSVTRNPRTDRERFAISATAGKQ